MDQSTKRRKMWNPKNHFSFDVKQTNKQTPNVLKINNRQPFNPLSPNSDQQQFSPDNVHSCQEKRLWEYKKWSWKRKCLDVLLNSLNQFLKEMYGDQFEEFVCGYWGLKG